MRGRLLVAAAMLSAVALLILAVSARERTSELVESTTEFVSSLSKDEKKTILENLEHKLAKLQSHLRDTSQLGFDCVNLSDLSVAELPTTQLPSAPNGDLSPNAYDDLSGRIAEAETEIDGIIEGEQGVMNLIKQLEAKKIKKGPPGLRGFVGPRGYMGLQGKQGASRLSSLMGQVLVVTRVRPDLRALWDLPVPPDKKASRALVVPLARTGRLVVPFLFDLIE